VFTPPDTCAAGTPVVTKDGDCKPITTFRLVNPQNAFPVASKPPGGPFVGDNCGCYERRQTEFGGPGANTCYSPTPGDNTALGCDCQ